MKYREAFILAVGRPPTSLDATAFAIYEAGRREGIREGKREERRKIEQLLEQLEEHETD